MQIPKSDQSSTAQPIEAPIAAPQQKPSQMALMLAAAEMHSMGKFKQETDQ